MKKNKKKKRKKNQREEVLNDNLLPQNIRLIGDSIDENKNIYIKQDVYKKIYKFTDQKTENESGGILVGYIKEEFGKTNIIVDAFIEAKYCDATPTTLKFTHKTWEYIHGIIDKNYKDMQIVGWIHTHPDLGIFLSEYDKFIHENFFNEDYQIAYVIDPIRNEEGMYFWSNGKIEKCKGFYVYDKEGISIKIKNDSKEDDEVRKDAYEKKMQIKNATIIVLLLLSVCLLFIVNSQRKQINELNYMYHQLANQNPVMQNQTINDSDS